MKLTKLFTLSLTLFMSLSIYSQEVTDSLSAAAPEEKNIAAPESVNIAMPEEKNVAIPENSDDAKQEIIKAIQRGIVIPLDKKEKSWMKLLVFSQITGRYNDTPRLNGTAPAALSSLVVNNDRQEKNFELGVDRIRFIAAANFFDKVFFFSQFGTAGLGGINNDNLNTLGQEKESQLSLITSYSELNLNKIFNIGIGLHNYRGVSRFNNAGLVDLITQDLSTALIPAFGHSDQFSYPLGVFLKGTFKKLRYQFSVDEASRNNLSKDIYKNVAESIANSPLPPALKTDALNPLAPNQISAVYRGAELLGGAKAGTTYSGYLSYQFLDEESDRISFRTGSYFGTKKVFNIGGGFFHHPNGSVIIDGANKLRGQNVNIYGLDLFYDAPINSKKDGVSFYGLFQSMDYGKNFNLTQYDTSIYPIAAPGLNQSASLPFANGNLQYLQLAYFNKKLKVQPYGFFQNRNIDTTKDREIVFGFGTNYLLVGPNVKLTAEYRNTKLASNPVVDQFLLQLIFFM